MMLVVTSVFVTALDGLEYRLKVCIYDEQSLVCVAELSEFNVGLHSV